MTEPKLRLVLATANAGKAAEIGEILGAAGIEVAPRPDDLADVDENGATLEENARIKALAVVEATGEAAVADDTGLEVDALGGSPGVHSARFAGADATPADNIINLLDALAELPEPESRTARFRTLALARFPDGREVIAEGEVDGVIALAPRGEHGFGYDPVFVPLDGDGRTFAEMSRQEKEEVSHRGRAFRNLAARLLEQ